MNQLSFIYFYALPIIALLSYYVYRKYSYWSDRGLKGPMSIFPFGYMINKLFEDPIDYELKNKQKYGDIYGVYIGMKPSLTISDVELAKNVMIKDFHLFINRREFNILDEIWKTNLFIIENHDWKRIRSITSPAFTSGKLRRMFPLLKQATVKLENYFNKVCKDGQSNIDIKEIITGYTIDVIASTSFATETDSNASGTKSNPFTNQMINLVKKISASRTLAILSLPKSIVRLFNIKHNFPYESWEFLLNVTKTIIQRDGDHENLVKLLKEANLSNKDLKNMNYNKLTATSDTEKIDNADAAGTHLRKEHKHLSDNEIISQSMLFFIAGFETTASTIVNTIFELIHNPEVQEKLYKEISENLADLDPNDIEKYYEKITTDIPYLEAVIKETLRKYPILSRLERRLDADSYELGGIKLERDTLVEISTVAIHYDEKNYSEPFKFNPDRFLPENKHNLNPYAYVPFGIGPRNCVGMRFAYHEIKICLATLMQKFVFNKSSKTPEKLYFPRGTGNLVPKSFDMTVEFRK